MHRFLLARFYTIERRFLECILSFRAKAVNQIHPVPIVCGHAINHGSLEFGFQRQGLVATLSRESIQDGLKSVFKIQFNLWGPGVKQNLGRVGGDAVTCGQPQRHQHLVLL